MTAWSVQFIKDKKFWINVAPRDIWRKKFFLSTDIFKFCSKTEKNSCCQPKPWQSKFERAHFFENARLQNNNLTEPVAGIAGNFSWVGSVFTINFDVKFLIWYLEMIPDSKLTNLVVKASLGKTDRYRVLSVLIISFRTFCFILSLLECPYLYSWLSLCRHFTGNLRCIKRWNLRFMWKINHIYHPKNIDFSISDYFTKIFLYVYLFRDFFSLLYVEL